MQKIVLEMDAESLRIGATTGMTVAEINLWLDVAKRYLLSSGGEAVDFAIPPDDAAISGTVGPPESPVMDMLEETAREK